MTAPLVLMRGRRRFRVAMPAEKLRLRAALPGAAVYDATALGFAEALAAGASPRSLLPAAMPASWMVNSTSESLAFKAWLQPELAGAWGDLLHLTSGTA